MDTGRLPTWCVRMTVSSAEQVLRQEMSMIRYQIVLVILWTMLPSGEADYVYPSLYVDDYDYSVDDISGMVCNTTSVIQDVSGTVTSPNYPISYPASANCSWVVQAPSVDQRILLDLNAVVIEPSPDCVNDSLEVFDGEISLGKLCLGNFFSNNYWSPVVSSNDSLTLVFTSNEAVQMSGFNISFNAFAGDDVCTSFPCEPAALYNRCLEFDNRQICVCQEAGHYGENCELKWPCVHPDPVFGLTLVTNTSEDMAFFHGDNVTYTSTDGYNCTGDFMQICNSNMADWAPGLNLWTWSGQTTNCTDIDECVSSVCGEDINTCENYDGGYNCSCAEGFLLLNNSTLNETCQDIDECATLTCGESVNACENYIGGYNCSCVEGFVLVNNGTLNETCQDIDECIVTVGVCRDPGNVCVNHIGNYSCLCYGGYQIVNAGSRTETCQDIDECMDNAGQCGEAKQTCNNTVGGYNCSCVQGYEVTDSGLLNETCTDINECDLAACGEDANSCLNFNGRYDCTCAQGYELSLDGTFTETCVDVDECDDNPCVAPPNRCDNNVGRYECQCTPGYSHINVGLTTEQCNIKSCGIPSQLDNSERVWTGITYGENVTYTCNTGYNLTMPDDTRTCQADGQWSTEVITCSDIDECLLGLCGNEANQCQNLGGTYLCTCAGGFTLQSGGSLNQTCSDIDECMPYDNPCGPANGCTNYEGRYNCTCGEGYQFESTDPVTPSCQPIPNDLLETFFTEATDSGPRFVRSQVRCSFVADIVFQDQDGDMFYPATIERTQNITAILDEIHVKTPGFRGCRILGYTKGSVIVDYVVQSTEEVLSAEVHTSVALALYDYLQTNNRLLVIAGEILPIKVYGGGLVRVVYKDYTGIHRYPVSSVCDLFTLKGQCQNGGYCYDSGSGNPACKCPSDRDGLYCQDVRGAKWWYKVIICICVLALMLLIFISLNCCWYQRNNRHTQDDDQHTQDDRIMENKSLRKDTCDGKMEFKSRIAPVWKPSYSHPSDDSSMWNPIHVNPRTLSTNWGPTITDPNTASATWGQSHINPNTIGATWGQNHINPNTASATWGQSYADPNTIGATWGQSYVDPNTIGATWGQSYVDPKTVSATWTPYHINPSRNSKDQFFWKQSSRPSYFAK